jgi:hypothetical protein
MHLLKKRETADRRSLCSAVDVNQRYVERDVPPPIITQAPRDIFYAPGRLYGVKIRVPGSKVVRRCRRATPGAFHNDGSAKQGSKVHRQNSDRRNV